MFERVKRWYTTTDLIVKEKIKLSICEILICLGCVSSACIMILRMFYGTEITDEAYYVSDAIQMLHGNIPYAYNNFSYGTGSAFLLIPLVYIYELIVPNNEGIFLFTRICYMLFWYICIGIGYWFLKKDFKRSHALLITGFMIPYTPGVSIYNFSYNSIPCALTYLSSLVIYDAVEHNNIFSKIKFVISGFLMGIALLAHPGYGIAIAIFAVVIILRSKGLKDKVLNLFYCIIGGVMEMLVVVIPIILQTSLFTLIAGINNKLNPYPTESMSNSVPVDKLMEVISLFKNFLPIAILALIFVLILSIKYICKKGKKLFTKDYALLAVTSAMFCLIVWQCYEMIGTSNAAWRLGIVGVFGIVILFMLCGSKSNPIILYVGLYPILFSIAQVIGVDSSDSVGRFSAAVPALAIYFLIMLENKSKIIRFITTISVIACILALGLSDFKYVYRDASINNLDYKVESGVFKGIYTTETRSKDLPELEEYLNSIVHENDLYAFRDNVPAGYLMVHQGTMIDKATWDCMNYSYQKNSPANLYEFYQRRGEFPRIYIYVDFGRDEKLSIEDENYKFNEFINTFYEKKDDFSLNDTFKHIVVYEYKGGFDGDFSYWIDRHKYVPIEN